MSNWIEWNGGECPVETGTLVDVKYRNGNVNFHVMAEFDGCDTGSDPGSNAYDWTNNDNPGDIIAYRLHNQYAATPEHPKQDMVNHPPHYQSDNGVECIDAIRAALGRDGFISYCRGNAMKYIWRDKLDNVEDWNKAIWYLNKAIEAKSE